VAGNVTEKTAGVASDSRLCNEALRLKDEVLATSDDPVARAEVTLVATRLQLYTERALSGAGEAVIEAVRIEDSLPAPPRQLRIVAAMGLMTHGSTQRSLALANPGEAGEDISTTGPTLESACAPPILALLGRID
jgi:hypothetical protein